MALGLSQGDVAEACGLGVSTISGYEAEARAPGMDIIEPWAAILDWSVASFLRACGITLAPVGAERLPVKLIDRLLTLSPDQLRLVDDLVETLAKAAGTTPPSLHDERSP